jgi:hypothetical protein
MQREETTPKNGKPKVVLSLTAILQHNDRFSSNISEQRKM